MKSMMKSKEFLITLCILILSIVIGFGIYFMFNQKPKTYKEITYSDMEELIDSHEKFILFVGKDSCSHCTAFKVTITEVIKKYGILVNYINLGTLSDTENAYINAHFAISGTPTTLLIGDGDEAVESRVLSKIKGAKSYSEVVSELVKYDFIIEE